MLNGGVLNSNKRKDDTALLLCFPAFFHSLFYGLGFESES